MIRLFRASSLGCLFLFACGVGSTGPFESAEATASTFTSSSDALESAAKLSSQRGAGGTTTLVCVGSQSVPVPDGGKSIDYVVTAPGGPVEVCGLVKPDRSTGCDVFVGSTTSGRGADAVVVPTIAVGAMTGLRVIAGKASVTLRDLTIVRKQDPKPAADPNESDKVARSAVLELSGSVETNGVSLGVRHEHMRPFSDPNGAYFANSGFGFPEVAGVGDERWRLMFDSAGYSGGDLLNVVHDGPSAWKQRGHYIIASLKESNPHPR